MKVIIHHPGVRNLWTGILLLALFAVGCNQSASLLRERGVKTGAQLAFKRIKTVSSGRSSTRVYTFTLYYFHRSPELIEEDDAQQAANDALWADSSLDINQKLERWNLGTTALGDFTSVEVEVSRSVYEAHQEGERIQIYYLPDDPDVVLPAEMVEE